MRKPYVDENAENKKSIKEFLMIGIPVGAIVILAGLALVAGITITEKIKSKKAETPEVATVETGVTGTENNTVSDVADVSDKEDTSVSVDSREEKEETKEEKEETKPGKKTSKETDEGNEAVTKPANSILDTGNLSQKGSGYEGTKGTGKYNYG
ncbi:MAG: hypothetical protein IKZ76_02575, partial [Lachnospiraceae bacterium]|nr:hypothetical protein [Lachnospiraceae bacterium]